MEKIAVHCPDEKSWDKVQGEMLRNCGSWATKEKGFKHTIETFIDKFKNHVSEKANLCMYISESGLQASPIKHWEEKGCKIISASEYLNEGGKDVKQFEVGDRVEVVGVQDGRDEIGLVTHILATTGEMWQLELPDGIKWYFWPKKY